MHHELSDEAAAQLCELLNDLAFAFERQYLAQTRRYYEALRDSERSCHNAQLDLFAGDDAQFSIPCRPHAHPPPHRTRSSTTGGEAQPICTTTTVFSARTAVPAHVRARLADDDGAL